MDEISPEAFLSFAGLTGKDASEPQVAAVSRYTPVCHETSNLGYLAFTMGGPEQATAVTGFDVALVRDGRIEELHTFLTGNGSR